MTIPLTDLQDALSPVPLATWASRWTRAAARAATISREEPVVLAEANRFGVVIWQAPAPDRTDRDQIGDVQFVGQWIAEPRSTNLLRQWQKARLKALFAPGRSFGACGRHSTAQMLSVVVGAIAGAAIDAYSLGGPIALVSGLLVGAVIGFVAFLALAVSARSQLHGPIIEDDADLLETVVALAGIDSSRPTTSNEYPTRLAHRLAWELTNPTNSAADRHRLRYQSRTLAQAFSDVRQAEQTLATTTYTPSGSELRHGVSHLVEEVVDVVESLQFRTIGLGQITEQVRGVRPAGTSVDMAARLRNAVTDYLG